ncbi:hypothetical protein NQ318_012550 [Aromia moschata]|uniref:Uncharacterized protein n=1 Tax=Aromia moschata TaxID=1265417 RepID=A0AAV8X9T0_9CUCU|nr:hypothetical protein NQ318_012550 [Aromia moschata]
MRTATECDARTACDPMDLKLYDVKSAQNQEKNVMGHHESEVCLVIKSEELDSKEEEDECDGQ